MRIAILSFALLLTLYPTIGNTQEIVQLKNNIQEAAEKSDSLALARAWYKLGIFYDKNKQLDESNKALKSALDIAAKINNPNAIATIANYLASNLSFSGITDSAIYYYQQALEASRLVADSSKLSKVLINLADEYTSIANYVNAANTALQAVKIAEAKNNTENLAYFLQKVGEIYKSAGEYKLWENYIQRAYQLILHKKCSNIKAIAAIYNDLGGIAEKKQEYEKALCYYDTLSEIGIKNDYSNAVRVALSNRSTIFKMQGNYKKALKSAEKASQYHSQNAYQQIYDNNLLSELYLLNNNENKAAMFALEALNNSSINNYPDEKARVLKNLYEIEKKRGNSSKALEYFELFKKFSDELRDKEVRTKIADLEIAYQTEKKERQIETLTSENKLKNQRLRIAGVLLFVLIIIVILVLYILNIRKQQAELKQNDLQQQVFRAQMNPHFIFNVLGSIQNFMQTNDTKKAALYLSQFASLIRSTLENSTKESISLSDEISMLKNYLELEKMRKPGYFDFKIISDNDLEEDFIFIPPMLIQPFIENAIKHGFKNLKTQGLITLTISDKTNWVEFIIEDNGSGIPKTKKNSSPHQSMAMHIFEKRRRLIQQKFKKDFTFELLNLSDTDSNLSGVRIKVNVPIIDEN